MLSNKKLPLVWLIVGGLAAWRITSILHREKIAAPIRKKIGIMAVAEDDEDPNYWIYPNSFIGQVFHCFWCLSVWVGMILTPILLFIPQLLLPFALSAMSIIVKDYLESSSMVFVEELEDEDLE